MKKRSTALLLACVLILGVAIGGTVAWLVDVTEEVENVFTIGDINISLWENEVNAEGTAFTAEKVEAGETYTYNFVPGDTLPKNPTVTVAKGSEACYIFVKIEETNNSVGDPAKTVLFYTPAAGWTPLAGEAGVYYKTQAAIAAEGEDADHEILANNRVTVNGEVTKQDAQTLKTEQPKLSFQAAAVQSDNIEEGAEEAVRVAAAYGKVNWN